MTSYADGSATAPSGSPLLPNLLNGYATRPPWMVGGVDYAVGVPAGTALKDPATIAMAGVSVSAATHTVTVTGSNVTLNGYDFGLAGGWGVVILSGVSNTVIENSHFLVGTNNNVPINAGSGVGNLTIQDNTLDGGGGSSGAVWALVNYDGSGTFTAQYNSFLNSPEDAIDFGHGSMMTIVEYNLFQNLGTSPGAHADVVQYDGTNSSNSVIAFNTVTSGEEGIQLAAQGGSTLTNTTIENNVIVAKGPTISISYSIAVQQWTGNIISGVVVDDNYIDYTGSYGAFYPLTSSQTTRPSNATFANNVNMSTGALIVNPTGSLSTDVSSVSASPASGTESVGSTIMLSLHMDEAEFVTGTPTLVLNDGGRASYVSGSGSTTLLFSYPVASTDKAVSALAITGATLPTGASVKDGDGNSANLEGAVATFTGLGIGPGTGGASPTAVADSAVTPENQAVTIPVLANDTDAGGTLNPASVTISTAAAHGTTSVNASTGAVTYTPAAGYYGADTFQYTVADTTADVSAPATVTVTVTPPSTLPPPTTIGSGADILVLNLSENAYLGNAQFNVYLDGTKLNASALTVSVLHGTGSQEFDFLGNWGSGAHVLGVEFTNDAYGGTATTDRNLYLDSASFDGGSSIGSLSLYSDGIQTLNIATSTSAAPPPPTAVADSAVTPENQAVTIPVLANDTDAGGTLNPASVTISTAAAHGTTSVNASTGAVTYTPAAGYYGADTFQYTVADTTADVSAPATVTVTITPPSTLPPPATIGSGADILVLNLSENAYLGNAQFNVYLDGTKLNASALTVSVLHGTGSQEFDFLGNWGSGAHVLGVEFTNDAYGGTATTDRNLYLDSASFDGGSSIGSLSLYSDGIQTLNIATSTSAAPPPPTAVADSAVTPENQAVTIPVLANDTDAGGTLNPASVTISTAAAHGTTSVNASTGAVTYTPAAGYYGADTFQYTVADTTADVSAPATVTVTVTPPTTGSGYVDGATGAPAGTPQLPTILSGYMVRPPWEVAGVDYAVGVPAGTTLKDPATIAMAGVSINTTNHTITVTGNNVTLNGYNFGLASGYEVIVEGANDTIENSKFVVGLNQGSKGTVLNVTSSARNFSLADNEIDGNNIAVMAQVGSTVSISSSGTLTIQYNYLHGSGGDMIDLNASNTAQVDIIQYNLFENIGVNTAHADTIQWYNTTTGAGSDIGFNTVYQNVNQPGPGNGGLTPLSEGPKATMTGLTVNNDTIIQTAADTTGNFSTGFYADSGGVASNIVIHDLYIDPTGPLEYTGSPWLPTGYYGDNLAHPMAMSNVINMVTGATVPVPSASNKAAQGYYVYPDASGYSPALSDVYSVTASPASGTQFPGTTITLTLDMDEAEFVSGTPTLSLNDGGTATYAGGSGTANLLFSYTVGASDETVPTLGITMINLPNGASIKDAVGNPANVAGAITTFPALGIDPPSTTPSVSKGSAIYTKASVASVASDVVAGNPDNISVTSESLVKPTLTFMSNGDVATTGGTAILSTNAAPSIQDGLGIASFVGGVRPDVGVAFQDVNKVAGTTHLSFHHLSGTTDVSTFGTGRSLNFLPTDHGVT